MRTRYLSIAVAATAMLTLAIVVSFAVTASESGVRPGEAASVIVAVLQIAAVMVVAALALVRARTRAYGWEAIAVAVALTAFVVIIGASGVDSGISMVMRPPLGLVGILAFAVFDTGRPDTRIDRWVTVPASLAGIGLGVVVGITATVTPGAWNALPCTNGCAPYGLGLVEATWWSTTLQVVFMLIHVTAMGACIIGLAQRSRSATGWRRAVIRPVAWLGGLYAALGLLLTLPVVVDGINATLPALAEPVLILRRLLLPLAIGAGMIVALVLQRQASRDGLLVLRDAATADHVQDAVQRLMADPELRLLTAPAPGIPRVGFVHTDLKAPEGDVLGVLEHRPPRDEEDEQALEVALPGAALALDRIRTRDHLAAASATERARMERDLHDGVQQHLVAMRMRLGLLEAQLQGSPDATREALDDLVIETEVALDELRSLARGEHRDVLAREGLRGALAVTAERSGRDVRLAGVTAERMPAAVEEALYFTFREALQNAMKHGDAMAPVVITARMEGADAVFEISDVGDTRAPEVPTATPRTIAERATGLGGTVETFSSSSGGVRISGRIPLSPARAEARDAH